MKLKLVSYALILGAFAFAQDTTVKRGEAENTEYYKKLWTERTKGNIISPFYFMSIVDIDSIITTTKFYFVVA